MDRKKSKSTAETLRKRPSSSTGFLCALCDSVNPIFYESIKFELLWTAFLVVHRRYEEDNAAEEHKGK